MAGEKKGFWKFGKKKAEQDEGDAKEKKGFFDRFRRKKDEPEAPAVAEPEVEVVKPESPIVHAPLTPEAKVDAPQVETPATSKPSNAPVEEMPFTADAEMHQDKLEAEAKAEPESQMPLSAPSVEEMPFTADAEMHQDKREEEAKPEPELDIPLTAPSVEEMPFTAEAETRADEDVAQAAVAEAADDEADQEEEKKGRFGFFKRNKNKDAAADGEGDAEEGEEKKGRFGFLKKLRDGLSKTRTSFKSKMGSLFLKTKQIDEDLLEELEEMLISSDIGVQTTMDIIEKIRWEVDRKTLKNGAELKANIKKQLLEILQEIPDSGFRLDRNPTIILVVGVNGVGKTTTIGKLAQRFSMDGKKVTMCAADTFRAAAVEQLQVWSQRANVDIVVKPESKDPAAVVFDALERVKENGSDVLLVDTAGRLHNNQGLMKELEKIHRIISRSYPDAPHHTLLILDAVTGQNGLSQAKQFTDKVQVSDLIITKLDGTAKGGIAIAIAKELNLPIQYIGVGEQMEDLLPFDDNNFVESLFEEEETTETEEA